MPKRPATDESVDYFDAVGLIGQQSPKKVFKSKLKKAKDGAKPAKKVASTPEARRAPVVSSASSKKERVRHAAPSDDESDAERIPERRIVVGVGSSVRVSDKVKGKNGALAGMEGTVVSTSPAWTKIDVKGHGEASFRASELVPFGAPKAPAANLGGRSSSASSVGRYPAASASGVSAAQASRLLGKGDEAASSIAAGALVAEACQHEVRHVLDSAAGAAAGAKPLVALLEGASSLVVAAIPEAVNAARSRRVAGGPGARFKALAAEVEALKKQEEAWVAVEQAAESAAAAATARGEGEASSEDDEDGEGDEDGAEESGPGFGLSLDQGITEQVETMALGLDEVRSKLNKLHAVAKSALESQERLAEVNKAHHFDASGEPPPLVLVDFDVLLQQRALCHSLSFPGRGSAEAAPASPKRSIRGLLGK